jgi:hypothetical protein
MTFNLQKVYFHAKIQHFVTANADQDFDQDLQRSALIWLMDPDPHPH